MGYEPKFTITSKLLTIVETIASLRERIHSATVDISWIPALQKDTRTRNVYASTAIEGNPLTLEQVKALEAGKELAASDRRSKREALNYFAGLRYIEKNANISRIRHEHLFELHRILADTVMDQEKAGSYRTIQVKIGKYLPPHHQDVSPLMYELLQWWQKKTSDLSPVLSSAILHYRLEAIHPFADGNGRTGRALALWELYRRGFDSHHIFSVDEYYWEDRPQYYTQLDQVRRKGEDLTQWLEYCARGLQQTLERAWLRIQTMGVGGKEKILLKPKQELLLNFLGDHASMSPQEIWEALSVSKQGAMNIINPLLDAGLIEKTGSKKTGRYVLKNKVS